MEEITLKEYSKRALFLIITDGETDDEEILKFREREGFDTKTKVSSKVYKIVG